VAVILILGLVLTLCGGSVRGKNKFFNAQLVSRAYPRDAEVRIDELAIKMYEMALGMIRRQVAGTFVFSRKSSLQLYHNPTVCLQEAIPNAVRYPRFCGMPRIEYPGERESIRL
jgi:hypothetical protein